MRHQILRRSLSLEVFLTQQTQKQFQTKCKELSKFLTKFVLFNNQMAKRQYDYVANQNPLEKFPNDQNHLQLKISSQIKRFYVNAESQYQSYETIFDKLEKVHQEYDRQFNKLIELNGKFGLIFGELEKSAQKHNEQKPAGQKFAQFDQFLSESFWGFFERNEKFLKNQQNLFQECLGKYSSYIKEYITSIRTKILDRNFISSEYYKAKIALNEKKNKTIM